MQYKGYEISISSSGCIIEKRGKYITSTPTESEAYEYIDELEEDEDDPPSAEPIDWYKRFDKYCSNLPGKCYPTNTKQFGTTNEKVLNEFIKHFEETTSTKIFTSMQLIDNEYYYIVTDVNLV